ncbi:polysaccharide biosynthesis chain length regulator sypO [Vibrio ishigakensis]|uniref:Polysaccharide biosynthesis chain length regulator sypO n=1 Tax=Vibrio ishigakensis TaxID=1481914 RepID=A0A0B8PA22_9VIBR|nr:polysaccharide biosynthesis chain length regulator sypO [Vibrio ishigakensis]
MSELKQRFLLIFLAAWRRRWVIVVPILVLPFVALGVSKLAPLSYTAHTSMLIQETAKMNPFLQDIAVSAMLNERLNAVQTLLKSRHILQKVALEQGLINENTTEAEKERVIQNIAAHLRLIRWVRIF